MSTIIVCGIDEMPATVARMRPTYIVSLLAPAEQPGTPAGVDPRHHHRVEVDDVDSPTSGYLVPALSHIEGLIEFLRWCDADAPVLIHCMAGISRSPAAALIALTLDYPGREAEAAAMLRRVAPHVQPNALILSLADSALQRGGALIAAGRSMGNADWSIDVPYFKLPRQLPISSR